MRRRLLILVAVVLLVVASSAVALAAFSGGPTGAVGPVGACLNPFVTRYKFMQDSMLPTLQSGDFIVVPAVASGATFARGEIVAFRPPASWSADPTPWVKRVVGLPGETISLAGGRVLVNGAPIDEPYLAAGTVTDPGGSPATTSWTLGSAELFVLGDNRGKSADSRIFGSISVSSVTGHATEICYPDSRKGMLP